MRNRIPILAAVAGAINSDSANAPGLATEVLRIVLRLPVHEHKEIAVNPRLIDSYLGTYRLGDFSMAIAREGDRLFAQIRDQNIPLSPESVRDYVLKGTDTQIVFVSDRNGRARELILRESGTDAYLNRIK